MPIPPPEERPDLYDDHDGQIYSPSSAEYIMAITSEDLQRAIEQKQGKLFAEIAKEMEADTWRRALMYHVVDGCVFRKIPGRALEVFDQETGCFHPDQNEQDRIRLGIPMDIDDARKYMHVPPKINEIGRPI